MTRTTDELLDEIRRLTAAIDAVDAGSREHTQLVERRTGLRQEAAQRADELRHPDSVRTEIERMEQRITEMESELIGAGYSEKHLHSTIQDPGAYRYSINRAIEADQSDLLAELNERLTRLRSLLPPEGE